MKTLVSIITPTYNHENFIGLCIESVLTQTFDNWEMIIINDCSTDNTINIISSYAREDKRIKVINHSYRWGLKKLKNTYNQALNISKGEFIAILEGDDYWPKDKLEKQIKTFKDKAIILSFGDCIIVNKNNNPLDILTYHNYDNSLNNYPIGSILYLFQNLNFYLSSVTVMIRRNIILKIGGFKDDTVYPFVDLPTWLSLSLLGTFRYKNNILGYHRKHEDSSWFNYAKNTDSMGRTEFVKMFNNFLRKYKKDLKKRQINVFDKKMLQKQSQMLKEKKKEKNISLIRHYLSFLNFNQAKIVSKKAVRQKNQSITSKILLFLVISGIVNNGFILKIVGYSKLLTYKLLRLNERIFSSNPFLLF